MRMPQGFEVRTCHGLCMPSLKKHTRAECRSRILCRFYTDCRFIRSMGLRLVGSRLLVVLLVRPQRMRLGQVTMSFSASPISDGVLSRCCDGPLTHEFMSSDSCLSYSTTNDRLLPSVFHSDINFLMLLSAVLFVCVGVVS